MKKMEIVKHRCDACGFAMKPTRKELFWAGFRRLWTVFFISLGILFLLFVVLVGLHTTVDLVAGGVVGLEADIAGRGFDYRSTALDMVGDLDCRSDESCFAWGLFREMKVLPYVSDGRDLLGVYPPSDVLSLGGECDQQSYVYTELARSVGVDATLACSWSGRHCVSRVVLDGVVYVVDMSNDMVFLAPDDFWSYGYIDLFVIA